MPAAASLYLELLKKSVLGELYVENEVRLLYLKECLEGREAFSEDVLLNIRRRRGEVIEEYIRLRDTGINYGRTVRNLGYQHTMIGRRRLENIHACLDAILCEGIPGDCIECGVWRGGAAIFMRGYLAAREVTDRLVWVADSFEGLPKPTLKQDEGLDLSAANYPMLAIDLETVRELFERYNLLDGQVRFLSGWFKDTLAAAPIRALSLLRVDGDLYESTRDALEALYERVAPGGFVIIDDYGCLPQCRQAVTDYRERHGVTEPIEQVDWTGAFWRKAGRGGAR
jgi:hypothetical protein